MHGGEKFGGLDFSKNEPCGTCFAASGSIRQCDPSHSGQPVATADNANLAPLVRTQVDQLAVEQRRARPTGHGASDVERRILR